MTRWNQLPLEHTVIDQEPCVASFVKVLLLWWRFTFKGHVARARLNTVRHPSPKTHSTFTTDTTVEPTDRTVWKITPENNDERRDTNPSRGDLARSGAGVGGEVGCVTFGLRVAGLFRIM